MIKIRSVLKILSKLTKESLMWGYELLSCTAHFLAMLLKNTKNTNVLALYIHYLINKKRNLKEDKLHIQLLKG